MKIRTSLLLAVLALFTAGCGGADDAEMDMEGGMTADTVAPDPMMPDTMMPDTMQGMPEEMMDDTAGGASGGP